MVAIVSLEPLGKEAVLGANRRIACWKYSRGQPRHRVKQRHVINLPDTETAKSYRDMRCASMSASGQKQKGSRRAYAFRCSTKSRHSDWHGGIGRSTSEWRKIAAQFGGDPSTVQRISRPAA
jgi:hypothetical protein